MHVHSGPHVVGGLCVGITWVIHPKTDGKGSGPAVEALNKPPPDLTQFAKHSNGHLPDFRILRIIDGYEIKAAHDSRDMPIWGDYFRMKQRDEVIVAVREHNLVEYIWSIQQR